MRAEQMAGVLEMLSPAVAPVRCGPSPVRPADREVPGRTAQPRGIRGGGGGDNHRGRRGQESRHRERISAGPSKTNPV